MSPKPYNPEIYSTYLSPRELAVLDSTYDKPDRYRRSTNEAPGFRENDPSGPHRLRKNRATNCDLSGHRIIKDKEKTSDLDYISLTPRKWSTDKSDRFPDQSRRSMYEPLGIIENDPCGLYTFKKNRERIYNIDDIVARYSSKGKEKEVSDLQTYSVVKLKEKDGGLRAINREEIVVDPDGDSSSLCTACKIPIFSTPSISFPRGGNQLFLHDHCSSMLPEHLVHELHPNHTLILVNQLHLPTPIPPSNCSGCKEACGTMFYQCPMCDFRLDLLCVSQIKIMHRSHNHPMTVIRLRDSSLTCSACDMKHESPPLESVTTVSYVCNICGYWIHPDCASLPNAIVHYEGHQHSLFLTYNLETATYSKCAICSSVLKKTSGVYICLKCSDYLVHIRCALTRPKAFKLVFIRDAEVYDLARLPMANENTSLIPYITSYTTTSSGQEKLHKHPLTLHEIDDGDLSSRVCNACVQFVSPPFFSCSECSDFFLHRSCAHLPTKIEHRVHKHPLSLSLKVPKSDVSGSFSCKGCGLQCNGFAYSCHDCNNYNMDVVCALINPAITHDSHEKTHILFMSRHVNFRNYEICNCCNSPLSGIYYECNICPKFKLHIRCALLPNTISHYSFDEHPLQLTTTATKKRIATVDDDGDGDGDDEICEVCEEHMEKKNWYCSCKECDQLFHVDCIPFVDQFSKIKLGSTVCVDGHGCALGLVREQDAICVGRCCEVCGEILNSSDDGLAYECSKCFFGIHRKCPEKWLLETLRL